MNLYPCPLCGKSFTRHGEPFDDPHQVVSHIDAARDAKHDGEHGKNYVDEIRENQTEVDPINSGDKRRPRHGSPSDPLEQHTIAARVAEDDEISVKVFLDLVDDSLDTLQRDDQQLREDIQVLEEEIESIRDSVDGLENDISRMLWYIEQLAREQDVEVILEDMEMEGHL